jgi:glycosyltransferase involved in cell wall biosynthesis
LTTVKYLFDLLWRLPKYDVVHVFSASYFTFVYVSISALLLSKLFGVKTILNYRSGEAEDFFSRWGKWFLPFVRRFDAVVAPSDYLVDVFAKFDVKARSINNFIAREKYIFRQRTPLRPIFLSNRILEPLYNIDCILRAFQIIQSQYPEAELSVAHEGIEKVRLENLSKELNLRNVRFVGLVPQEKIAELYDSVDIYLNSPNLDCMPGSLIECFASGLPIVSTNAGGIPYIVNDGQTGLLVDCDDHQSLAARAIYLLKNADYAGKIIAAARAESEKYSWENVREKWLALYEKPTGQITATNKKNLFKNAANSNPSATTGNSKG